MNAPVTLRLGIAVVSLLLAACGDKEETEKDAGAAEAGAAADATPGEDAGATVSSACYVADQFRCRELPAPTAVQRDALEVECSSASGSISSPATCPTAGYVGKCTVAAEGEAAAEVRRWYKAEDAAYQQDFCVNTAHGIWTATF